MNEEEKEAVEELKKQLRLAMNIDDIATTIRNGYAQIILNLLEKLQKENEEKTTILLAGAEKIKQLEKENETLKNFVSGVVNENIEKDFIPVQKVKDKIEEIQEEGY